MTTTKLTHRYTDHWSVIYCNLAHLWLHSKSQWLMCCDNAQWDELQPTIIQHGFTSPPARQLHRIAAITRFLMYLPYHSIPVGSPRHSCSGRRYNSLSPHLTRRGWRSHICFIVAGRGSTTPSAAYTNYQRCSCNRHHADRPARRTGRQMRRAGRWTPPCDGDDGDYVIAVAAAAASKEMTSTAFLLYTLWDRFPSIEISICVFNGDVIIFCRQWLSYTLRTCEGPKHDDPC